jgi:hypothetical protein
LHLLRFGWLCATALLSLPPGGVVAFAARGACPARGKLDPAGGDITPEAQLTDGLLYVLRSERHRGSGDLGLAAQRRLSARGKLNPQVAKSGWKRSYHITHAPLSQ